MAERSPNLRRLVDRKALAKSIDQDDQVTIRLVPARKKTPFN
jgi:hypothetical protein